MATHDYVIDNSTGANVRADLNLVLQAILSNNSSSSAPSTTAAYMLWVDTTANIIKIRNSANNAWINLFTTAGGVDVDAASNFNEDVTFTGASANIVFDKSDNAFEFADNAKAIFGGSADLQIYHSTNTYLDNITGGFYIRNTASASTSEHIYIQPNHTEHGIIVKKDAAVELYYNGSKKFETTSSGATVTGNLIATGNLNVNDNGHIYVGNSGDLDIYHDGTSNIITSAGGNLFIQATSGESGITLLQNGGVELYFDNSKHFQTTGNGVEVDGELMIDPDAGGTLKFTGHAAHHSKMVIADNGGSGAGNFLCEFGDGSDVFNIASNGNIRIAEAVSLAPNAKVAIAHNGTNPRALEVHSTGSSFQGITLMSVASRNTTNGSYRHFQCVINGVADKLRVADSGNVTNSNNSYGSISDERLKENKVDASSQWDDIKALRIRKFNFKSLTDPDQKTMLGVVAQEAELVCPNLVTSEVTLQEGVEQEYKSFKYSVLYMKAIKCLQEAQAKIETLETKVAALEAA